jgi:hypothetical protein
LYELPYKYEYGNVQFIRKIGINWKQIKQEWYQKGNKEQAKHDDG